MPAEGEHRQGRGVRREGLAPGSATKARPLGELWWVCWALGLRLKVLRERGLERGLRADGERHEAHTRGCPAGLRTQWQSDGRPVLASGRRGVCWTWYGKDRHLPRVIRQQRVPLVAQETLLHKCQLEQIPVVKEGPKHLEAVSRRLHTHRPFAN